MNKLHFLGFFALILAISTHESNAQYGGGYGNNGYGNGGMRRNSFADASAGSTPNKPNLDPEKMATDDTKWMTKKLKLTEEQVPKVENVNINFAFKRLELHEELQKIVPPVSEDVRQRMLLKINAMKEQKNKDLKAILTEEQYQVYLKKKDSY
jgi:hypothetical protein